MTGRRNLKRIMATTDVHSAFADAQPMLTHLHAAQRSALVVDCGDFFEGSGYYRLAHGRIEHDVLTALYDVIVPGNHGWTHYFEPALHELTVCANALDHASGDPLFRRLHITDIGGRRVAVTAVIGPQAFNSIPITQRATHRVTNPAQALREVMLQHHHEVDSWVLLSHSGFSEDLKLAAACPFLDVIFSGHCHSDQYAPVRVGETLVLKGRELGIGYALAEPSDTGWAVQSCHFANGSSHVPSELAAVCEVINSVGRTLTAPLGIVNGAYRNRLFDRHQVLAEVAARLHTGLGAQTVILNETVLRPTHLGGVLTRGDLLAIEPFDNQLVHIRLPDQHLNDIDGLITHLAEQVGPLVTSPQPLPQGIRTVLTTDYLADTYLGGRTYQAGLRLSQAVQRILATPLCEPAEGETT